LTVLDALSPAAVAAALAAPPAERAAFLRSCAEAGHAEAQAVYAQMLLDGVGVDADPPAAFGWFRRAAAQHHLMALNMVGRCCELGWGTAPDASRAAQCYRAAAEAGLVEAMYNYATRLALGDGVGMDRTAALGWLERAAALGYAKAVNFVGSFAEDGWAGPRDMVKAARCYAQAADGGDFRGAFNHARMLADAGDLDGAVHWIARASERGHDRFRDQMRAWLARAAEPLRSRGLAAC